MVRELIFSGFELEMYSEHEIPWIYWYIFGPLNARQQNLGKLLQLVKEDPSECICPWGRASE